MKAESAGALIALWLTLSTPAGPTLAKDKPPPPKPTSCVQSCKANLKQCKLGCERSGTPEEVKKCKDRSCTILLKSCIKECAKKEDPEG